MRPVIRHRAGPGSHRRPVDFFTPIVDNPRDWGAIAAANAVSDVYAMGGKPLFALNLVGWPREKIPFELLGQVLDGAAEVLERAACPAVGGHSIDDPEPKFGLAVDRGGPSGSPAHQRRWPRRRCPASHQAARHRDPHHRAQAKRDRRGWARRGRPGHDHPQ
jgi:hypothetical protein